MGMDWYESNVFDKLPEFMQAHSDCWIGHVDADPEKPFLLAYENSDSYTKYVPSQSNRS